MVPPEVENDLAVQREGRKTYAEKTGSIVG
jgi:hypothetical protein